MTDSNYIEAQECRGDFWLRLEDAMQQCGGGIPIEHMAEMKLGLIVDILAQNGIRMVYDEKWHINKLSK